MAAPLYLYSRRFFVYTATNKKRPGPKLLQELRTALDPHGVQLLERVLTERFDEPDNGALQRLHLLSLAWAPAAESEKTFLDDANGWECLAYHHPAALRALTRDVSELLTSLAFTHLRPSAEQWREALAEASVDVQRASSLAPAALGSKSKALAREAFRASESKEPSAPFFRAAATAAGSALYVWKPPPAGGSVKGLWAPGRSAESCVERACKAAGTGLGHRGVQWTRTRLREILEGAAGPLVHPAWLPRGPNA